MARYMVTHFACVRVYCLEMCTLDLLPVYMMIHHFEPVNVHNVTAVAAAAAEKRLKVKKKKPSKTKCQVGGGGGGFVSCGDETRHKKLHLAPC